VTWVVFLDTGVLGYITHPKGSDESRKCTEWLSGHLKSGNRVCVPEVCDYELRREYIRNKADKALEKLDKLKGALEYVPITTPMMLHAAALWAEARSKGKPTAHDKELDVDMILVAQAKITAASGDVLTIATTDVGDLPRFTDARAYTAIPSA
jgi:predicted nucleic acid-binding protein